MKRSEIAEGDFVRPNRSKWKDHLGRVEGVSSNVTVRVYDPVLDEKIQVDFDADELDRVHPLEVLAEEVELL